MITDDDFGYSPNTPQRVMALPTGRRHTNNCGQAFDIKPATQRNQLTLVHHPVFAISV
jgi:hypothetical protein